MDIEVDPPVGVGPWEGPWPDDPRLDPELLAGGDRRNVVDAYRYWRHEAVVADLDTRRHAFHVAIENWQHDLNIGSVVRTANAFLAAEVHVVGRRRWNRRGAMVTDRYQHVRHHPDVPALAEWAAAAGLPLVGVDNQPGSEPLERASAAAGVRAGVRPGGSRPEPGRPGGVRADAVDRAVRLHPVDQRRRRRGRRHARLGHPARRPLRRLAPRLTPRPPHPRHPPPRALWRHTRGATRRQGLHASATCRGGRVADPARRQRSRPRSTYGDRVTERVLVVGGDAAGMSAAATAKRRGGDALEVVVVERSSWTSYSACGIPYWVAGEVDGPDALVARSPEEHRERGIDVRTGTTATAIDLAAGEATVRGDDGEQRIGFDQLVIATGAEPVVPDVPGADAPGVHGVQTLDDGCRLLDSLQRIDGRDVARAVVVGGGYIGLEMAEACLRRGLRTTLVDQADEPMAPSTPTSPGRSARPWRAWTSRWRWARGSRSFETGDDGWVRAVTTGSGTYDADIVVLGIGVRPRTDLADAAGLPLGESGGLRTDSSMAVVRASRRVGRG